MLLGELPGLKKLVTASVKPSAQSHITKRVALDKLEVVPCFHVSPVHNRESIYRYGLKPMAKPVDPFISYGPRLFLSTTYEDAAFDYVNFEGVDTWLFYLPKQELTPDEFSDYGNHYYTEKPVPWYKLILLETC
jgi:hypothetical protein